MTDTPLTPSAPTSSPAAPTAAPIAAPIAAPSAAPGNERPALPDRLSIDPRSPHFSAEVFKHSVGIRLNGKERIDVGEYCISEGWVKVPSGKTVDRRGNPLMLTLKGKVESFYK